MKVAPEMAHTRPAVSFGLGQDFFVIFPTGRGGAVGHPSGMTADDFSQSLVLGTISVVPVSVQRCLPPRGGDLARARATKLEASAAVGECDPTTVRSSEESQGEGSGASHGRSLHINEGFHRACEEACQFVFQLRARGLDTCSDEVGRVVVGSTIGGTHQKRAMRMEERLPTVIVIFAHELAELRACIEKLRSQLQSEGQHTTNSPRTCQIPFSIWFFFWTGQSPNKTDFAIHERKSVKWSAMIWTLIENAEANLLSNRFNPLSCW